jgi:hypothetical protein
MAALTRDFYILAPRIATGFSAEFFSIQHIAQARDMCTLLALLICHFVSFLSSDHFRF